MFFRSIRFKISILYMAILAITLASFSAILYHNVRRGLYENMDTLLMSRAEGVSQAINTYWETSNLEEGEGGARPEALRKRRNVNFANVAERWVKQRSNDPRLLDIIVHIFDTDGHMIASSKGTLEMTAIPRKHFISVLQGKRRYDTAVDEARGNRINLRIFTTPVFENEKVAYIVQVAGPLMSIEMALAKLKFALFILFPATVLATGVVGAFLAKVTLSPVNHMIDTINKITAENLKLRLRIPNTRDEVQKMAETFNVMLGSLERSFASQRQLFEDLSHELKTPLTILKGEFEVLLKNMRTAEDYEAALRSGLEEIDGLIKIVEDLLLLARFDSKQISPEKERLRPDMILRSVMNTIKSLAEIKNITVSLGAGDLPAVYGDEDQIGTLFLNLLDNAIKYTPEGGTITISAKNEKGDAKISIRDTGIGIPEEHLPHIFERFYRFDGAQVGRKGFGLGLSIARSIAELHHGTITVQSHPHEGSVFTVILPGIRP